MRNETSFTAPTSKLEIKVRLDFISQNVTVGAIGFHLHSMAYKSTLCSEREETCQ